MEFYNLEYNQDLLDLLVGVEITFEIVLINPCRSVS